eukprot:GHVH01008277.1.p1 GENE.GHVH01008277.1~~GHVH01008277.1.p1  ORF type:complete len:278 (-),score=38.82 GHVH01008277.1:107-940(-)
MKPRKLAATPSSSSYSSSSSSRTSVSVSPRSPTATTRVISRKLFDGRAFISSNTSSSAATVSNDTPTPIIRVNPPSSGDRSPLMCSQQQLPKHPQQQLPQQQLPKHPQQLPQQQLPPPPHQQQPLYRSPVVPSPHANGYQDPRWLSKQRYQHDDNSSSYTYESYATASSAATRTISPRNLPGFDHPFQPPVAKDMQQRCGSDLASTIYPKGVHTRPITRNGRASCCGVGRAESYDDFMVSRAIIDGIQFGELESFRGESDYTSVSGSVVRRLLAGTE